MLLLMLLGLSNTAFAQHASLHVREQHDREESGHTQSEVAPTDRDRQFQEQQLRYYREKLREVMFKKIREVYNIDTSCMIFAFGSAGDVLTLLHEGSEFTDRISGYFDTVNETYYASDALYSCRIESSRLNRDPMRQISVTLNNLLCVPLRP